MSYQAHVQLPSGKAYQPPQPELPLEQPLGWPPRAIYLASKRVRWETYTPRPNVQVEEELGKKRQKELRPFGFRIPLTPRLPSPYGL